MIRKSEVLATVEAKKEELEVLVSLGAGDIENYASQITEILKTTL
jgi:UDP-N-acetylmuramate-alanine ligase